jgi:multiple sugar transport system ATP-binding protein
MASISLRNVTKIFDRTITAVRDLSLEVGDGELLVLVGPSGCGKTTTLSLIAGLDSPTSGEIRLGGQTVNHLPPRERDVAMVFQNGALYPHMSVHDNLAFALRMRGVSGSEVARRVASVAQMLGVVDLMNRRPADLSGGQRQRVALGRAIVRQPAAFLLDEPLTSLDAGLRLAMRREIKSLHERLRITTLYVTHDQSEAMALAQRVCVLRDGRIQQVGLPGEIYAQPVNRFVAGFFGTPAMNFLTGCIRSRSGAPVIEFKGQIVRVPLRVGACLRDYPRETIIVGVRPHDLSIAPIDANTSDILCGRVSLVEPLGSQTNVHVDLACGQPCVVVTPPRTAVSAGDDVRVSISPDNVHLFEDTDAGRSLVCKPATEPA